MTRARPIPETHRLMADLDAALKQQILDITQRERKPAGRCYEDWEAAGALSFVAVSEN